jgi:hypothetical protein
MSKRAAARITQPDLDRIFKAAKKAGVDVRVTIESSGRTIVIETGAMADAHLRDDTPEKISELIKDAH